MRKTELEDFLAREFPQIGHMRLQIELVADKRVRVRLPVDERHLRPGGTVAGPTMVALADIGIYLCVLAMIGPRAQAVTTSLTTNFLRRPEPKDLLAEVRLLKLGRRLAVGEVHIFSDGSDEPVAQVAATYSLPPAGEASDR